jgi:hypothetical protein
MGFRELLDGAEVGYVYSIGISVLLVLGSSSGALAGEGATGAIGPDQIPGVRTAPKSDRLDQGSCWYAIFFCSQGPDEALRWTERHAGRVIDTLSLEFPRLKKGFYCAVEGPLPRKAAVDRAQSSKGSGRAPGAYAKEGC